MRRFGNFINGSDQIPSQCQWFEVFNPSQFEESLGEFVDSSEEIVDAAVKAAVKASSGWALTPGPSRSAILYKAIESLEQHREEIARIMTKEQGKPLKESLGEIGKSIAESKFMVGEGLRLYGQTSSSEKANSWTKTVRVPVGPIAAITPWNFPILTPLRKIMPALVTGNTVVLKPSELTPRTALRIAEIFSEAGLPNGVFNVVTGGAKAGMALIQHPDIRAITFTGSTTVGRQINRIAADRMIRFQAEMGGKNPVVIWDYEYWDEALQQIINAAFTCTGQRCTAISRVIVPEKDIKHVEKRLKEMAEAIKIGDGLCDDTQMGPLVSEDQINRVDGFVKRAMQEGARLVTGGHRLQEGNFSKGYFYTPTLLADVKPSMEIATQEVFGPVLTLEAVNSIEEALQLINQPQYGLTAAIFSNRLDIVGKFVDGVQSGMVHVNHGTSPESHMPFGGVKSSQIGPGSVGSLTKDFFTDVKTVYIKYS